MTRLFVVEDEAIVREDIVRTLTRLGYEVVGSAQGGVEALVALEQLQPALVLMDIRLSGRMDGIQTTAAIRKRWSMPVIYLTAHSDEATLARAKETGPHGYLLKPFNERDLRTAIEVALKKHELEARLEQRERWFSATLDSVGDAVIATDLQERITFMDPVAERVTGWKRADAQHRPLSEVLKLVGRDAEQDKRVSSAAARGGFRAELPAAARLVGAADDNRRLDERAAPVVDAQGQVSGSIAVFRDVTDERRLGERLQLAEREAAISTMAASMAHQINSPLAASIANDFALDRLREAASDPELVSLPKAQLELLSELSAALEDARAAGVQMRRIVLALKKFSRVDEPLREKLDLPNVLNAALGATEHAEVRVSLRLGTTPLVEGNEGRLVQAIASLLTNAFEAVTAQQERPPQVELTTHTDDAGRAVLEIRDNGNGIAPAILPRIFEPFFTTKAVGSGLGLGLSLARSALATLGGEIAIESRLRSGTTARVSLPANERPRDEASPTQSGAPRRARVLVIDDEPLLGKTLARMLGRAHDVSYEQEGQSALARIERGERFDVILCDLMMPRLTGMDVLAQIQRLAPDLTRRVVFLTGGVASGAAEAFLETCTNAVIHKPFSSERVRAIVASYAT